MSDDETKPADRRTFWPVLAVRPDGLMVVQKDRGAEPVLIPVTRLAEAVDDTDEILVVIRLPPGRPTVLGFLYAFGFDGLIEAVSIAPKPEYLTVPDLFPEAKPRPGGEPGPPPGGA